MSAKIIIYVGGKPSLNGHRQREFLWSAAHGLYLYEGVEFDASEFNAKYDIAMRTNPDLRPRVKVMSVAGIAVAPVTTITAAREITADEAEEVLARLRPDRLKKKTGPKPQMVEVA